ncbi:MAG: NAD(P)-binding domain-containing protein, partial [Chloroflexi bacterium]|nr:NAD(P)-binding domain-containing protein [Chloroflexota bacterium]
MARIGIIGLGYVGLPLAVAFAEAGEDVLGVDLDPRKATAISERRSYIEDVSDEALAAVVSAGRFRASTTPEGLRECDAILICLPTPIDEHRNPDLRPVLSGAETAAENIKPGALLVLESTTYPGTTREEIAPILERHGGRIGTD